MVTNEASLAATYVPTNTLTLTETPPLVWQERIGIKLPIATNYEVSRDGIVRFRVSAYDPALPLIVDPSLQWTTRLGGNGSDRFNDVALDEIGNIYLFGRTTSTDITTPGPYGLQDAFLVKLNPSATTILYRVYLGGNSDDYGEALAIDAQGNPVMTGYTWSTNFPPAGNWQPLPPLALVRPMLS